MSDISKNEPALSEPSSPDEPVLATASSVLPDQTPLHGEEDHQRKSETTKSTTTSTVDQLAYAQYKSLAQAVLESAEIAGKSAEAALASGHDLKLASQHIREVTDTGIKKARLLLAISAGFMLLCLIFFLIMGVRLVSRVHQLDIALDATAQKVAEMQVGLETLDKLSHGLGEMSQRQADLTKTQSAIESRIDAALKQTEAMTQKVPVETAKQVATRSDTMLRQVQSVGSGLQAQSKAVQDLSKEVQSLKAGLGQVDGLKRDVETLVTLQRERYLEVLQKNQTTAKNHSDRMLQYPRPAPTDGIKPLNPH